MPPQSEAEQDALFYHGIHPDGYEVIFIDDNGERLSEIPPPIRSEQAVETPNSQAQEDMPTHAADIPSEYVEEKNGQLPQNEVEVPERTHSLDDDFDVFLDSLSRDELRALEKFLMTEFNEPAQPAQVLEAQSEAEFLEQFSHTDITHALEKLYRSGGEEAVQKFFAENPELSTHFQKYLMNTEEDPK